MSEVWDELRETGYLSSYWKEKIAEKYGKRGEKAINLVEAKKITKYKDFFVVRGTKEDHVVEADFCTCRDFQRRGVVCAHILAIQIATAILSFEEIDLWYQDIYGKTPE